jgi:branched-chain amino acid aminotransferase
MSTLTAQEISPVEVEEVTTQPAAKPAFGTVFTKHMVSATYSDGAWSEFAVKGLENYSLHPASLVLHYSQTIFEGMKAYRHADGGVSLFRPYVNAARLNQSAARMAIPQVDEEKFVAALRQLVAADKDDIPARPGSLYLRPAIFASETAIGVRASTKYEFMIIAMPVESYFSTANGGDSSIELLVTESVVRASPGGTGDVKAGANYAITLKVIDDAKKHGCGQVMFLNSGGDRLIEEAGGMNVFVVRGKKLMTPKLTGTILSGVTRRSLLELAPTLGLEASEEAISIDSVIEDIATGAVTEVFLCGTAAVVVSVNTLRFEDGRGVVVGTRGQTPVAEMLADRLQGIQFGEYEDEFGWVVKV